MKLLNKKLTEEEFFKIRKEILSHWKTGKQIEDIQEGIEYAKSIPESKNFAIALEKAKKERKTLIQPRAGVALVAQEITLLKHLSEAGADLLPNTIDSYTRQNKYENCEKGIIESRKLNRSMLNGFPAVNHGITGCRKVLESVDKPLQARHGTPDARLLSEIIYASGWTSNEGGGISYNIPYSKDVSIEQTLRDWQYIDRLTGYYEEHGVKINREPYGPLTGTLVPPSTSNTVAIVEALLVAEQGVKNITVGYGQCGNLVQDVAAIRALQDQTEYYLKKYGYNDIIVTTVFHQWMGGFPSDESKAFGLISLGAAAAAYAGAHKVIVKTPHESIGIPTKEANAAGIKATRTVVKLLGEQLMPDSEELVKEIKLIKAETDCMINELYKVGDGDLCQGVIKGIEIGIIDMPFAPSKRNKGIAMPARDYQGKSRYLEFGNIPFTDEIKKLNHDPLLKRAKEQGRELSFQLTVDDIFAVSAGVLIGKSKEQVKKEKNK